MYINFYAAIPRVSKPSLISSRDFRYIVPDPASSSPSSQVSGTRNIFPSRPRVFKSLGLQVYFQTQGPQVPGPSLISSRDFRYIVPDPASSSPSSQVSGTRNIFPSRPRVFKSLGLQVYFQTQGPQVPGTTSIYYQTQDLQVPGITSIFPPDPGSPSHASLERGLQELARH